jgi:hypothetical protein
MTMRSITCRNPGSETPGLRAASDRRPAALSPSRRMEPPELRPDDGHPSGRAGSNIDAMGRGRNAAMLATLAICDYQHARRANTGLADLYGQLYETVHHQFGPEQFVTAQMMRFDASTGRLQWVNAGHPVPLLIRDHRVIQARTPTRRGAVRAGALHQLRGARSARRRRRAADGPGTVALPDPSPRRHDRR